MKKLTSEQRDEILKHLEDVEARPMVLIRMKARLNENTAEEPKIAQSEYPNGTPVASPDEYFDSEPE